MSIGALRWAACALLAIFVACRIAPSPSDSSKQTASDVLTAFIAASDAGDFHRAW